MTPHLGQRRSAATVLAACLLVVATSVAAWAYTPLGNPRHYTLVPKALDGGIHRNVTVRWNPCTTINYRVNPTGGGAGALADARRAVGALAVASGLRFHYLGTTTYIPPGRATTFFGQTVYVFDPNAQRQHTGADLVIAWARPGHGTGRTRLLSSTGEDGVGGYYDRWSATSRLRITDGFAVIRSDVHLLPGFGRGLTRGHFLLHELGHAVGLDHYSDGVQAMTAYWRTTNRSPAQYNAGDITGLHRVGRAAGCITP